MANHKFGIVSSFDIACGNAFYSDMLVKGLSTYFDVERISLDQDVFQRGTRDDQKWAIKKIRSQIEACRFINFQFELILYGKPFSRAAENLIYLFRDINTPFSITWHRVDVREKMVFPQFVKSAVKLRLKQCARIILNRKRNHDIYHSYEQVLRAANQNGGTHIVHTYRELRRLKMMDRERSSNIYVHPIVYPSDLCDSANSVRPLLTQIHRQRADGLITLGLFGFVTEYKNYGIVLDYLTRSQGYLYIIGGTHPEGGDYGGLGYITKLNNFIVENQLTDRVRILVIKDDADFVALMRAVDIVILPYLEVGQSASGIASLALQYAQKVCFSNNHSFAMLQPFIDNSLILFEPSSGISLDSAIDLCCRPEYEQPRFSPEFSYQSNVEVYLKSVRALEG